MNREKFAKEPTYPLFYHRIQEYIKTHRTAISQNTNLDIKSVLQKWTVTDIEELGTNRTFGYQTRSLYYDDANSLSYLPHIKTPTLVLTSQDDPFLGYVCGNLNNVRQLSHGVLWLHRNHTSM